HHAFAGHDPLIVIDDELSDSDTVDSVVAHYRAVAAVSDRIVRGCPDVDQVAAVAPFGPPRTTLRWLLTHLVEEVGRHAGHADILRELLDGSVGR
ncbi:MAG TPA: DUF664 domain-containing protein, partial [Mycobacteriales bacterium]|nr:DUF664 domain-containing protein [Mycobacteriales bacterium]